MNNRQFPIIQNKAIRSIPWAMIAPHGKQAIINHSQTLERLAERGGLDAGEALSVLDGKQWNGRCFRMPAEREAADVKTAKDAEELIARVAAWESARKNQ